MVNTPRTPPRWGGRRGQGVTRTLGLTAEDAGLGGAETADETCGKCQKVVRNSDSGLQCEKCDTWFHIKCENISLEFYKSLSKAREEIWFCTACEGKVKSLIDTVKALEKKNDELQGKMECLEDKWDNLKDGMVKETMQMVLESLKTEMNVNTMGGITKKAIEEDVKVELLKAMKEEEEEDKKQRATNLVLNNVTESTKEPEPEREIEDLEFCEKLMKDGVAQKHSQTSKRLLLDWVSIRMCKDKQNQDPYELSLKIAE